MRVSVWLPKTPMGWVVAFAAGTLLFLITAVVQGIDLTTAARRPSETNAYLLALIVALVGGSWIGTQFSRYQLSRREVHNDAFDGLVSQGMERMVARAEADASEARRVRAEPWYADAAVDLQEASRRWFDDGHGLPDSALTVPNPYFVLPLEALVKWGFASAVEVREATRWATSNTPPVRWQNPVLREKLNVMGWTDAEAYARVGLLLWRTDPDVPDPQRAAIEAKLRVTGHIYDVPRPVSLP